MLDEHLPGVPLTCLTDVDPDNLRGVYLHIALEDCWPGWWSKMEAFTVPGPAIFLDLDTAIVGDLSWILPIAEREPFTMLRDAYRGGLARQSSVMTWNDNLYHLTEAFGADPGGFIGRYTSDQTFIEAHYGSPIPALQDIAPPDSLLSFKVDVRDGKRTPKSLVFFHGNPRPWQQKLVPYALPAPA